MLKDCPNKPNCVFTQASRLEQRMPPLQFRCSPQAAMAGILKIVQGHPRTQVVEQRANYLHVTFKSRIFRFVDDVEFDVDGEQQVVHFRSASRLGYSDLGANRKRMQQITQDLLQLDGFTLRQST